MSQDRQFFDRFALVLGGLVLFAVVIYFIAATVAGKTQLAAIAEEPLVKGKLAERMAPVGQVAIAGESRPTPAPAAAPAAAAKSGEDVYKTACVTCHGIGIAGAPKFGDAAAWAARRSQGTDVLYEHAIVGFQGDAGLMPAKGGQTQLSDDEVRAAVDYMIENSR